MRYNSKGHIIHTSETTRSENTSQDKIPFEEKVQSLEAKSNLEKSVYDNLDEWIQSFSTKESSQSLWKTDKTAIGNAETGEVSTLSPKKKI